jgi:hypothetical protein
MVHFVNFGKFLGTDTLLVELVVEPQQVEAAVGSRIDNLSTYQLQEALRIS